MKKLLVAAFIFLSFCLSQSVSAAALPTAPGPEVKFVVTPQKIWVLADETLYSLPVQIQDAKGKVVMEKEFTAKCSDWSMNVEKLPAGEYTVRVKGVKMTSFKK